MAARLAMLRGETGGAGRRACFTDVGPEAGPIRWKDGYGAIGAPEAPDDHTPIGMALGCGWGEGGAHVWKLIVHGAEVPGRGAVVDR